MFKRNGDEHISVNKVCLVCYSDDESGRAFLTHKLPLKSANKYIFPIININYEDVPKTTNTLDE